MAKNTQKSNAAVNAEADALARLLDNGYLRIYGGAQPTNADTALSGQTLLAELRFAATSAPAASNGVLTFNTITGDTSADATGTATWFRCLKDDGSTAVFDGTVDVAGNGPNMSINSVAIQSNAQIAVSSFVYSTLKSASGF